MEDEPRLRLAEGRRLLDSGDPHGALSVLAPLTGHPDRDLATDAWLSVGTATYRLDDEPGALAAWQRAAAAGGANAWLGWRSAAEQLVREGRLEEAILAYREADRRAPPAERGAIANRLAWLLKESGHDFAARRQFNRARGAYATYLPLVTNALLVITVAVFLIDSALGGGLSMLGGGGPLLEAGFVAAPQVAAGEWWRILTSAFLHLGIVHIGFNMYALWLFGPVIEELYGHVEYLAIYLLCAAGGSVLTILAMPDSAAVGASGAIFGLLGLAFAVSWRRHLVMSRAARATLQQAGGLILINLVITFSVPQISWTGHVGGLLLGVVIGLLLAPSGAATLSQLWQRPDGQPMAGPTSIGLRALTYAGLAGLLVVGTYLAVVNLG